MVEYEEELKAHLLMSGCQAASLRMLVRWGDEDRWPT
jgi:hypothetical protein